ncbi:hypothetical protein EON63_00550 [archaeon]|nr:MAG: hypothetical protein EON63_00550 [archaeon]
MQLLNRKQFLEYKLKLTSSSGSVQGSAGHSLSSGMAGNATSMSAAERAELIAELSELRGALSTSIKQFEKMHNEPFAHPAYNASSIDLGTSALSPKKL